MPVGGRRQCNVQYIEHCEHSNPNDNVCGTAGHSG